jgi:hypothetical protein
MFELDVVWEVHLLLLVVILSWAGAPDPRLIIALLIIELEDVVILPNGFWTLHQILINMSWWDSILY